MWSWTESGWFEPYYGNVQPLSGGHVLVASGHRSGCEGTGDTDRTAFVAEVDADGEEHRQLELVDPRNSLIRAQLVAPCDLYHHTGRCDPH